MVNQYFDISENAVAYILTKSLAHSLLFSVTIWDMGIGVWDIMPPNL